MAVATRIPVLMYHRVGIANNDWERRYCISPEVFEAHMSHLATRGKRACSVDDFFSWLSKEKELPEGSFLLTFDDGFQGIYDHAFPVLNQLDWSATVFLVSSLIGGQDEWTRKENPAGIAYPLLSKEQIITMRSKGVSFHSHTRLHSDLTAISDDVLVSELAGSREDLESLLGEDVRYIAYPYGRYNDRVVKAAYEAGYQAAFSTQPGFNRRDIDRFRIRRMDIFGTDTPSMLARKIFYGTNDGSLQQTFRYYKGRLAERLGI